MVFSVVIPSTDELNTFYSQYGASGTPYFSPITAKRYRELLDEFEDHTGKGRIHDAGCGFGFFLSTAEEEGWDASGSELSERAVNSCLENGLKVTQGESIEGEDYHVITSFEVIEHLRHPQEYLKMISESLKSGGLVYITTPNFNGLSRFLLGANYNVINFPEHLCYFTRKTLDRMLREQGFRKVWVKTDGISIGRIATSIGASNEELIRETSPDEKLRQTLESGKFLGTLKVLVNKVLSVLGIGVSLKALYRKEF